MDGEGKAAFKEGVLTVWVAGEDQGQIKDVVIPEGAKVIVEQAFFKVGASLTNVTVPTTLEDMGKSAFSNCKKLTSIDLSNSKIVKITDRTFYECKSLSSVHFPATLEEVGDEAFWTCKQITGIDLSNTRVTKICASAFSECSSLLSVFLPATLKEIGPGAFKR